jgi:hypothetical protein
MDKVEWGIKILWYVENRDGWGGSNGVGMVNKVGEVTKPFLTTQVYILHSQIKNIADSTVFLKCKYVWLS